MKKLCLTFLAMLGVLCCTFAAPAPKKNPPAAAVGVVMVPVPPHLKMMLPEIIYAAPGIESNIYFENVLDSATPGAFAYEVVCKKGKHGNHRWSWTPTEKDAGKTYDLELRLFNDYGMVLSGKTKIVVANKAKDPKKKITLAMLAASGSNSGYPAHLLSVMREHGFVNYTPVGKHSGGGRPVVKGGVAHDGYGGFSWNSFLSRWVYSEEELSGIQDKAELEQMRSFGVSKLPRSRAYRLRSPLLRVVNGKKVLDIPHYFRQINGGKAPDFIIIQLGGNDMFSARREKLDERVAWAMKNAHTLLTALRKHAPNAVIGVCSSPLGCSQDGFGANYGCGQSQYQYRRNIQRYNRELDSLIKSFKDPRIVLVPLHPSIDPRNSYITRRQAAHARTKKCVIRDVNALHYTREGGAQTGDAIYCFVRKYLEK